jgi:hypothetical protein
VIEPLRYRSPRYAAIQLTLYYFDLEARGVTQPRVL